MSLIDTGNEQGAAYTWPSERNGRRRATLQALCLGAALEIVNLLDADGADHTYTAQEFAAIIYKNIHASTPV